MLTSTALVLNNGKLRTFCSGNPTPKMTASSLDCNPLLEQSGLPKFQQIKPSQVEPAITQSLDHLKNEFREMEKVLKNPQTGEAWGTRRIEYDYPGVIEQLEKIKAPLSYSWGVVGHLMGVKNSDDLRAAHKAMQPEVVKVFQTIGQSEALFTSLSALKKRESVWSKLDETKQRVVEKALKSMENSGVGLDEANRKKFNELSLEASSLSTKFNNNVLDSTKAFKLRLTDPKDVDGT